MGVCTPWVDASALAGCGEGSAADPDALAAWARIASDVLYHWSGRQFAGECTTTARPRPHPSCGCWPAPWAASWDGWAWRPFLGGYGTLRCGGLPGVRLAGAPITGIASVTIGGVVVDPAAYTIAGNELVRLDGLGWPACQDDAADPASPGAFVITYYHGQPPPELGVQAARVLACELYHASVGEACGLPTGVTRVVRQGITYEIIADSFSGGPTGLPIVDLFRSTYNPAGLRRRPAVFSPDSPRFARRT